MLTIQQFTVKEHPELSWRNGLGPTYNGQESQNILKRRYLNAGRAAQFTIKRLLQHEEFLESVRELRKEGWLDWQILGAVATIVVNARIDTDPRTREDIHYNNELFRHFTTEPEDEKWAIVPQTNFSIQELKNILKINMVSTLTGLGLECHQQTPDFVGIERFLASRYQYKNDDISHDDPFPGV